MRIRKRWPPPPPPPAADLQSSTVSDDHNTTTLLTTPPIQSLLLLRSFQQKQDPWPLHTNHNTSSRTTTHSMHNLCLNKQVDPPIGGGEDEGTAQEKENIFITSDQRTGHHQNVETSAGSSMSSSFSNQEHWCEEDKVFPIKKRRASFKSKIINEMVMDEKERNYKMYLREKRKINKKWDDDYIDGDGVVEMMDISSSSSAAKKKSIRSEAAGNKMMIVQEKEEEEEEEEGGSRCSRVNGRGWRCCKPALAGYSLCEHHRSIRKTITAPKFKRKKVDTSLYSEDKDDDDDDDKKKGLIVAKKRRRIGMTKARSISSLLDQTIPSPPPLTL